MISWCLLHLLKSIVLSPLRPLQFIYWRKALSYRIAHFGSCWWYPWGYTLTHYSVFCISYELVLGYRVSTRLGIYLFIYFCQGYFRDSVMFFMTQIKSGGLSFVDVRSYCCSTLRCIHSLGITICSFKCWCVLGCF